LCKAQIKKTKNITLFRSLACIIRKTLLLLHRNKAIKCFKSK
jgi:hypothetical protein